MTEGRREQLSSARPEESPELRGAAPKARLSQPQAAQPQSSQPRLAQPPPGPLLVERHRKADGRLLILYRDAAGED